MVVLPLMLGAPFVEACEGWGGATGSMSMITKEVRFRAEAREAKGARQYTGVARSVVCRVFGSRRLTLVPMRWHSTSGAMLPI